MRLPGIAKGTGLFMGGLLLGTGIGSSAHQNVGVVISPTPTVLVATVAPATTKTPIKIVPSATPIPATLAPITPAPITPAPATPVPQAQNSTSSVYYANCSAARAAGAAPVYQGDPGYRSALDRDDDGVGCE